MIILSLNANYYGYLININSVMPKTIKPKSKTWIKDEGLAFSKSKQTRDGLSFANDEAKAMIVGAAKLTKLKKLAKQTEGVSFGIEKSNNHVSRFGWIEFPDGKRYYMRSGWERNVARHINWLKGNGSILDWKFEPCRFDFPVKRGNNSYLPDFWVKNKNGSEEWWEVKGYFNQGSRTKMKRFLKFFPAEKLVIIDKNAYREIAKQCRNLVVNWE